MSMTPSRREVLFPGGVELAQEAEKSLDLGPNTQLLSVGCGTGELEVYFAAKWKCHVTGIDTRAESIERAAEKANAWQLSGIARFEVGDGTALRFEDGSFDVVFCSGALGALHDRGLREFHRVLKPRGRCAISDDIWRHDEVPDQVVQRWTRGVTDVLTLQGHCAAFEQQGLRVLLARAYHERSWWESFYDERSTAPNWIAEREDYERDQEHLGLGLFVIEKV